MTALSGACWAVTDDDGTGQSGTIGDAAWVDAVESSINALIHSATNPTVSPTNLIDEVVTARGSMGTLDARLDVSLEENGALKSQASLATLAQLKAAVGGVNLLADPTFLIWAAGDAAAPSHWNITGGSVARCGTGLGNTNRKVGAYSVGYTGSGAFYQDLLPAAVFDDGFDLRDISYGAWVVCSTATAARIYISDGAATTYSSYHTGGGGWEWLTLTHPVNAGATVLRAGLDVAPAGVVGFISGPTCVLGSVPPSGFMPAPSEILTEHIYIAGAQTVGADRSIGRIVLSRPAIIKAVLLHIITAPTGADLIVDVNVYDGGAQSMFTTKPRIVAGAQSGAMFAPDGTYRYRCINGCADGAFADRLILTDIDQVGSGVAGSDLHIIITYLQYSRPLEAFLRGIDMR